MSALLLWLAAQGCSGHREAPEPVPASPVAAWTAPPSPQQPEGPLDLRKSVDQAMLHAPSIRTARARADASVAGIDLADTAYLPRVDLVWQELRATRNNISVTTFPQGVLPAISGPVGKSRSWDNGWGSNAGALLSYEPLDFGLRSANAEVARLSALQAQEDVRVTKLDVAAAAAEAFLAHLATLQALRAARANLERWEVFAKTVRTLADRELRPGADASHAEAEVASARNGLLFAEQTVLTGRLTLAEAMGWTEPPGDTDPGPLLELPRRLHRNPTFPVIPCSPGRPPRSTPPRPG